MLTGVFLFLFGIGFSINSFSLVLFFTPLYVLVNVWELKKIEEPELIKRLGDEYIEYRRHTPMFIPEGCVIMKGTNNKLRRLLGLVVKAFILATVVAVILPLPQYASSLSDEDYIVWLARLIWVLMLTVGGCFVLLLVGFLARKLQNKTRKTG